MIGIAGGIILATIFWALLPLLTLAAGILLIGILYILAYVLMFAVLIFCVKEYPNSTFIFLICAAISSFFNRKYKKKNKYL